MLFRHYPYASTAPLCWQELPHGLALKKSVSHFANQWSQKFVGHHLLKLGALTASVDLDECFIPRQFSLSDMIGGDIRGDMTALPIGTESIDALLSFCTLEFYSDPYAILREIDRTLIKGGHLILACFNPYSLASLRKCWPKYQERYPWNGHFYSASRIQDWLKLLNYQLVEEQRLFFNPLTGDYHGLQMNQNYLNHLAGFGSSIYMLHFVKRASTITPIKPKMHWRGTWQPIKPSFCFDTEKKNSKID